MRACCGCRADEFDGFGLLEEELPGSSAFAWWLGAKEFSGVKSAHQAFAETQASVHISNR